MVTPIDLFISDTHFMSTAMAQCPSFIVRYHPEITDYYFDSEYAYLFEAGAIKKEILKIENMQTALRPLAIWYKNKFQLKSYDASVSIKGWLHIAFVCLFIMVFFYGLYALIGISIFNFFTE